LPGENVENGDRAQSRYSGSQLNFTAHVHQLSMSDINNIFLSIKWYRGNTVHTGFMWPLNHGQSNMPLNCTFTYHFGNYPPRSEQQTFPFHFQRLNNSINKRKYNQEIRYTRIKENLPMHQTKDA
jgi:hypothetical protein